MASSSVATPPKTEPVAEPAPAEAEQEGITLRGGCHCTAISYTISIPPPEARAQSKGYPHVDFDHCASCRRTAGAILQAWITVPFSWCAFTVSSVSVPSSAVVCKERLARALAATPPAASTATSSCGAGAVTDSGGGDGKVGSTFVHYVSSTFPISTTTAPAAATQGDGDKRGVVARGFCGACGTSLTYHRQFPPSASPSSGQEGNAEEGEGTEGGEQHIGITLGSLDADSIESLPATPAQHSYWVGDGVGWLKDLISSGRIGLLPVLEEW